MVSYHGSVCRELFGDVDSQIQHGIITGMENDQKFCPECGHVFQGNGWDGIDAHWKAHHGHVMSYEKVWKLIQSGTYKRPKEDFNQAAFRVMEELIRKSEDLELIRK